MPTRTIRASAVTFAFSGKPGEEFHKTAHDRIRLESGAATAFFRFLIDVPRGETLVSAELLTTDEDTLSGSRTRTVQAMVPTGDFRDLNWNNRPSVAAGAAVAVTQSGASRTWVHNVTADAVANVGGRVTWRMHTNEATKRWLRGSRDNVGYPRLRLVTEVASSVPTNVSPSGVVATSKPFVSWLGVPGVTKVQVQIDEADGDFSTPVFDSGEVSSSKHELNLAATAFAGLTAGVEYDLRAQYRTAAGQSGYSEPVSVTFVPVASSPITNPDTSDADPTPPVVWTPIPNQTAWQVRVLRAGKVIDDSGKRPGADGSWTPTKGAVIPGEAITRTRWLWDEVDRVNNANAPTYSSASVTTTWDKTATVAPVDMVVVSQPIGLPCAVPAWTRTAGVPDQVAITHGGKTDYLDGVDSGTKRLWTLRPNTPLDVEVAAVVNGKHSTNNPTRRVQLEVTGVWLVDPETGRGFVLSGTDGLTIAYGGVTTTHTPLTAAALVTRTSALRGAEGSVRGWIDTHPEKSEEEQVDDLWWLRERPAKTLRLIMGDLNIPVKAILPEAVFDAESSLTHRIRHKGSFGFAQTSAEIPRGE